MYLIFYIGFKFFSRHRILTLVVLYFLYATYELVNGRKIFLSSLNFLVGVSVVHYKDKINMIGIIVIKRYLFYSLVLFIITLLFMLNRKNIIGFMHQPLFFFNSIIFVLIIYLTFKLFPNLNYKIVKLKFLNNIGLISYELYLIHYIFIKTLPKNNEYSFCVEVLFFSIIAAYIYCIMEFQNN
jgi:peptidoglycan/LPS O-acetylase OafA/YrhL